MHSGFEYQVSFETFFWDTFGEETKQAVVLIKVLVIKY